MTNTVPQTIDGNNAVPKSICFIHSLPKKTWKKHYQSEYKTYVLTTFNQQFFKYKYKNKIVDSALYGWGSPVVKASFKSSACIVVNKY